MKITFEGQTFQDIVDQMEDTLDQIARGTSAPLKEPVDLVDIPVDAAVDTAMEKPAKPAKRSGPRTTEEQIAAEQQTAAKKTAKVAAAAKMRAAKQAKKAAKPVAIDTASMMEMPPPPKTAEGMDPIEVAKIRVKTIEELQTAYANGYQKEVLELLARFGNGAKSFREVPVEAFVPIREAIDNGALT